ncbi:MAG TPA: DUF87 domain-containing protein [Candidatus Obscuribacterales bacterium]
MQDFEKLGVFYLGQPYDLEKGAVGEGVVLYESANLTTHAVCIGMTGSGKTGLCVTLIEEAAIDGIPVIAIDPKGDIANLLLMFEGLTPHEFLPWISDEEARLKGVAREEYARQIAESWQTGLAKTGQGSERIKRLKDSADFAIYTPGSSAGLKVSVVRSFSCPPEEILEEADLLSERVSTATNSLLTLAGVQGDALRSREHILVASILLDAWKRGKKLTLLELIEQIQKPPMTQVGALDVESFFPAKDRFNLAMAINGLIASPAFESWMSGEPLDIDKILYSESGKPRVSIFSIAHLNDQERMFFVSLLLNEIVSWMRAQSGTQSLRAMLYMDEIFGYFPPVANPPSKRPLLTLLKQARAFGLGVLLATQNPVDLDYKGLANAGTWFVGRLQTERDKARLIDGLEGVAAEQGARFDRQELEQVLSSLGKRVFLMNNVHTQTSEIFQTRWTMSYLRGPLSRSQIKTLMEESKNIPEGDIRPAAAANGGARISASQKKARDDAEQLTAQATGRTILPTDVPQFYLPCEAKESRQVHLTYVPMILGVGSIRFVDVKTKLDQVVEKSFVVPIRDAAVAVDFSLAREVKIALDRLQTAPQEGARFGALPQAAAQAKNYAAWSKAFVEWLLAGQKYYLLRSEQLKEYSRPGETEREFRIRLSHLANERRDEQARLLRNKYSSRFSSLEDRIRNAEQTVERQMQETQSHDMQAAISVGATVLGAFLGRKVINSSTIGRATTAARGVERSMRKRGDVDRARDDLEALMKRMEALEEEFQNELARLDTKYDASTESLETSIIAAKKSNISVRILALAWVPHYGTAAGELVMASSSS